MVGFYLKNTLSEQGYVSRGVCQVDENHFLETVNERTHIERKDGTIQYKDIENGWLSLDEDTVVSMNMWGFTPDYFEYSEKYFVDFLKTGINDLKSEYFIPTMVDHLIASKTSDVKVLETTSKWFGVTYAEDREVVVNRLKQMADDGQYPSPLW